MCERGSIKLPVVYVKYFAVDAPTYGSSRTFEFGTNKSSRTIGITVIAGGILLKVVCKP